MNKSSEDSRRFKRAPRRDGLKARSVVLEAAGRVFAERGFAEATSKEICKLSGVNSAAVNYYFGSKENLYEEVLIEAQRQMMSLDVLSGIVSSENTPEEKLRDFLRRIVQTAVATPGHWGIRVILREFVSPSRHAIKILPANGFPKADKLSVLIQEITGLPPDSAHMQRAVALVAMPCVALILFYETLRPVLLPASASVPEELLEDMLAYSLGGLRALSDADRWPICTEKPPYLPGSTPK
ncbi:MAG: TetR/AcrR family transcriptional regulator [Synergistaceae bacterium]|jgi:AcrR family transcriptional regulator|nr:TetR/AcrR family transcriptional regulator [Synergistaceae bacterium]